MLKKILKHTLRTLLVILLVLLLVPALLYVRPFRTWPATGRRLCLRTLGMEVSVERIRLAFPLRLTVDNTLLADRTDTLLRCGRLSLDAALWPLIRKEVVIRSFALERVAAHYKDTLAAWICACCGRIVPRSRPRRSFGQHGRHLPLVLADADIRLNLTEAAPPRKRRAPPPCRGRGTRQNRGLEPRLRDADLPAVSELSVRLADGASTPAGCCWTASRSP